MEQAGREWSIVKVRPPIQYETNQIMKNTSVCWVAMLVVAMCTTRLHAGIEIVTSPQTSRTNSFYVSNRTPLEPSQFIPLPIDAFLLVDAAEILFGQAKTFGLRRCPCEFPSKSRC